MYFSSSLFYKLRLSPVTMPLESEQAEQTPERTRIAADINGIVGVHRGGLDVRTFCTNSLTVDDQHHTVFAFVGLQRVPLPITETVGSFGRVHGCYPTGTVVNVEQELNKQQAQANILLNFPVFKKFSPFI